MFEQLSFWGATVGANITDTVPVVGGVLKGLLLGGPAYNEHTLSRFFILHAAVLPVTIVLLVAIHLTLVRLQGVTELRFADEDADAPPTFNFFPDHLYTERGCRPAQTTNASGGAAPARWSTRAAHARRSGYADRARRTRTPRSHRPHRSGPVRRHETIDGHLDEQHALLDTQGIQR